MTQPYPPKWQNGTVENGRTVPSKMADKLNVLELNVIITKLNIANANKFK